MDSCHLNGPYRLHIDACLGCNLLGIGLQPGMVQVARLGYRNGGEVDVKGLQGAGFQDRQIVCRGIPLNLDDFGHGLRGDVDGDWRLSRFDALLMFLRVDLRHDGSQFALDCRLVQFLLARQSFPDCVERFGDFFQPVHEVMALVVDDLAGENGRQVFQNDEFPVLAQPADFLRQQQRTALVGNVFRLVPLGK